MLPKLTEAFEDLNKSLQNVLYGGVPVLLYESPAKRRGRRFNQFIYRIVQPIFDFVDGFNSEENSHGSR